MDQERLKKIEFGQEYMNAELLTYIEKFKKFDGNIKPVVAVLCSENRLLTQMNQMTDGHDKIDFHVCGTFNDINDAVEKSEFSDAIIVDTSALKIAPVGLYDVLKSVEELGKDVYFILSGWETLPKDADLCKKKLSQLDNVFPFSKIKASTNVYTNELDGFSLIEDVMEDYSNRIMESFSFIHNVQIEALYKKLRREIHKFREQMCSGIQKEQSIVLQLHRNLTVKQQKYVLTFSHAIVNVNDTLERFERMVKDMEPDDVLAALETDSRSAKERYFDNQNSMEREAKKEVFDKISNTMDSFKSSVLSNASMSSKTRLRVDEMMNDLLTVTGKLNSCRYISRVYLDELEHQIRKTGELSSSAQNYDDSVFTVLDRVKEALYAKIYGFQFETLTQNELKILLDKLMSKTADILSKASSIRTDSDKHHGDTDRTFDSNELAIAVENDGLDMENMSESERLQEAKWHHFCNEVPKLIDFSKNALSVLISDHSRIINEEIDSHSKNAVNDYFSFIIEKLDLITNDLNKQLIEFGSADL